MEEGVTGGCVLATAVTWTGCQDRTIETQEAEVWLSLHKSETERRMRNSVMSNISGSHEYSLYNIFNINAIRDTEF